MVLKWLFILERRKEFFIVGVCKVKIGLKRREWEDEWEVIEEYRKEDVVIIWYVLRGFFKGWLFVEEKWKVKIRR